MITWAVVLGSSIVMLVWIVIYSLFESFDFIDEVIVLFGGVTFWATVLLSVAIALSESPPPPDILALGARRSGVLTFRA